MATNNSAASRALFRIYHDQRFTIDELAEVAGVSVSKMRMVINGTAHLTDEEFERLARYLVMRGEKRLANCVIPSGFEIISRRAGQADGSPDNEVKEAVHGLSEWARGVDEKDLGDIDAGIAEIEEALADMKAERDRVAGALT